MAPILQPLDVSINHPFKDAIKHICNGALSVFKDQKIEKVREKFIQRILKAWKIKKF